MNSQPTCIHVLVGAALVCRYQWSAHMLFISSTKFFTHHLLRASGCCTGVPEISGQPTYFSFVQLNFQLNTFYVLLGAQACYVFTLDRWWRTKSYEKGTTPSCSVNFSLVSQPWKIILRTITSHLQSAIEGFASVKKGDKRAQVGENVSLMKMTCRMLLPRLLLMQVIV